jgi:hypothetical protein
MSYEEDTEETTIFIKKFKKKPIVIEAVQYDGTNKGEITEFLGYDPIYTRKGIDLWMNTLEGPVKADTFDWVIKGIQGEYYPCKPDIFRETYEEV